MFLLERLVFQGTERCPQYVWKQIAMCQKRAPLECVIAGQLRQYDWRISELAHLSVYDLNSRHKQVA